MKLRVKVKPSSKESKVEKVNNDLFDYEVRVKSPAVEGKANSELLRVLAKEFSVSVAQISIKNPKSRIKIIDIDK